MKLNRITYFLNSTGGFIFMKNMRKLSLSLLTVAFVQLSASENSHALVPAHKSSWSNLAVKTGCLLTAAGYGSHKLKSILFPSANTAVPTLATKVLPLVDTAKEAASMANIAGEVITINTSKALDLGRETLTHTTQMLTEFLNKHSTAGQTIAATLSKYSTPGWQALTNASIVLPAAGTALMILPLAKRIKKAVNIILFDE
jgi:hypothetical protein